MTQWPMPRLLWWPILLAAVALSQLAGCAAPTATRPETWINEEIATLYAALHEMGHAHSVESWQGSVLVGGLYGIAIGGAFFGESMFSRATDASKTALAHLVARLKLGGFTLLDTQFVNQHLVQFGAIEIPRIEYHNQLAAALDTAAVWLPDPDPVQLEATLRAFGSHAPGQGGGES